MGKQRERKWVAGKLEKRTAGTMNNARLVLEVKKKKGGSQRR